MSAADEWVALWGRYEERVGMLPAPPAALRREFTRLTRPARARALASMAARVAILDERDRRDMTNTPLGVRFVGGTTQADMDAFEELHPLIRRVVQYAPTSLYSGEVLDIYHQCGDDVRRAFSWIAGSLAARYPGWAEQVKHDVPGGRF